MSLAPSDNGATGGIYYFNFRHNWYYRSLCLMGGLALVTPPTVDGGEAVGGLPSWVIEIIFLAPLIVL